MENQDEKLGSWLAWLFGFYIIAGIALSLSFSGRSVTSLIYGVFEFLVGGVIPGCEFSNWTPCFLHTVMSLFSLILSILAFALLFNAEKGWPRNVSKIVLIFNQIPNSIFPLIYLLTTIFLGGTISSLFYFTGIIEIILSLILICLIIFFDKEKSPRTIKVFTIVLFVLILLLYFVPYIIR
ncbi:hypothetical protein J4233_05760 [Candidatus Pacearchaeota archaeon]|nr:hypothetical protein [uncultured archaeon]MBS3077743.1 hypothetical protein [Candidatus Pacearchaeota archaeon]